MGKSSDELEQFGTGEDACRSLRSCGPDWDAAIEFGIDVSLLVENVRLSIAQRIALMDDQNRFADDIKRRTVPTTTLRLLAERELLEKQRALDTGS